MYVCCEWCMLSGRDLCDELITPPEESYRLRCVVMCDLETSRVVRPLPAMDRSATGQNVVVHVGFIAEVQKVFKKLKIGVINQGGPNDQKDSGFPSNNTT